VSRLVFNESRHTYSLDGAWVPGASTVAKSTGRPDPLVRWAARAAAAYALSHLEDVPVLGESEWVETVGKAHERLRDSSMLAGKQLHSIAERLVFGDPVETGDPDTGEPYSDDVVRMGEQVARFMDRWDVSPDTALVEQAIFNEDARYAGRFDLVATLRGGDRWCIDYKTGATGVWPDTALQLTAYARATHVVIGERDMLMPPIQRCAALWVRPDTWELVPVKSDDAAWATFRHALDVYRWNAQRRDAIVGAALPVPEEVAS
jgi:hypothetical protein